MFFMISGIKVIFFLEDYAVKVLLILISGKCFNIK